ncbi:MAG: ABC transporter substrate-binding protein [Spirochaetota bacterium]
MKEKSIGKVIIFTFIVLVVLAPAVMGGGAAEEQAAKVIELVYWRTLSGAAGDAQDELAKMFNESQGRIHVTVQFQGDYTALGKALLAAYAAGGGPHVSQLGTFEMVEFSKSQVLVDLNPYLKGKNGIDTSDWAGTMATAGEYKGGTYWLPFNVSVPVLYYNTDAFKEAGLIRPPATWDEFFEAAKKLTVKDNSGNIVRAGVAQWNITWPLLSAVWSEGGSFNSKDYSKITINDPRNVDILSKFQKLIKEGGAIMPDSASGGHRAAFINGRAAMILDSPAPFQEIFKNAVGFTPAVANYPAGKAGKVYAPGGGGIVMSATCPEALREAAWEFMKYMLSPESLAYYAERSGYAAFSKKSQQLAADMLKDQRYAIMHDALSYLVGDFSVNSSPAVRNALDKAIQRIFIDKVDVKTALDEADAQAEKAIVEELNN